MYTKHLPAELPENWVIAELDEENDYLEFLGFEGEFLVSIMKDTYENPDEPFHLVMNPLKGILSRYDFEKLNWPECFAKRKDAVQSAVELMTWMNQNYPNFDPVTLEVYVSVGTVDQLDLLQGFFLEKLSIHDLEGQPLVFRKVRLLPGAGDYAASAIETICHYAKNCTAAEEEFRGGLLTNERFQLIEDLRPAIRERLNLVHRVD